MDELLNDVRKSIQCETDLCKIESFTRYQINDVLASDKDELDKLQTGFAIMRNAIRYVRTAAIEIYIDTSERNE